MHDALDALSLLEKAEARESLSEGTQYFFKNRYPKVGYI